MAPRLCTASRPLAIAAAIVPAAAALIVVSPASAAPPPLSGPPAEVGAPPALGTPAPETSAIPPRAQGTAETTPAKPAFPSPKPRARLLRSRSSKISRGAVTVKLTCRRAGRVSLIAGGPGRLTGLALGSARFRCRAGRAVARVRVPAPALRRVRRVSLLTAVVTVRDGGGRRTDTLLVTPPRRLARAASGQWWTMFGWNSECRISPVGDYYRYVFQINYHGGAAARSYWRPWILYYSDATGYGWVDGGNGGYYGPIGQADDALAKSDAWSTPVGYARVTPVDSGKGFYLLGAIEVWGEDWNYVEPTFASDVQRHGVWCYVP